MSTLKIHALSVRTTDIDGVRLMWGGKYVEDLTRDELISALKETWRLYMQSRETTRKIAAIRRPGYAGTPGGRL